MTAPPADALTSWAKAGAPSKLTFAHVVGDSIWFRPPSGRWFRQALDPDPADAFTSWAKAGAPSKLTFACVVGYFIWFRPPDGRWFWQALDPDARRKV
jgi:hypothetical protein